MLPSTTEVSQLENFSKVEVSETVPEVNLRDSSDILENAMFYEDTIIETGRMQGKIAGLQKGFVDGEVLGARLGRSLGEEIGFYIGFVHTWLSCIATELDSKFSDVSDTNDSLSFMRYEFLLNSAQLKSEPKQEKNVRRLLQLGALLHSFPILSPENPDLQDNLASIRAKFRICIVRMGILPYFNQNQESISF